VSDQDRHHVHFSEQPRGVRRRCVQFAIAMTSISFGAFLSFAMTWAYGAHLSDDGQVVLTLGLINLAMGIKHGIHARLKLQNMKSGKFVSDPSAFDYNLLALSVFLLTTGCRVGWSIPCV